MGNNRKYRKALLHGETARQFSADLESKYPESIIVSGVSRFEESKGIEHEVDCIGALLKSHPELVRKFVFLRYSYISENKKQSRKYDAFRRKLEAKIKRINTQFCSNHWVPIIYDFNRKLDDAEVTGLLKASDILIVASLADGFNHLVLEAIHSQTRNSSIQLLLSDIGATDYISGYRKLSHNVENDANILYDSFRNVGAKSWLNQRRLNLSARKLSSKKWASTIINHADGIRRAKA